MRTGAAAEQARRRRTVAGECSEGAGGKRFLGEKRTFTCSLHETKWQPDRGRRDARIAKFCIASVFTARYAGCTPSVRDAVGTVTCPVGKKYDLAAAGAAKHLRLRRQRLAAPAAAEHLYTSTQGRLSERC